MIETQKCQKVLHENGHNTKLLCMSDYSPVLPLELLLPLRYTLICMTDTRNVRVSLSSDLIPSVTCTAAYGSTLRGQWTSPNYC